MYYTFSFICSFGKTCRASMRNDDLTRFYFPVNDNISEIRLFAEIISDEIINIIIQRAKTIIVRALVANRVRKQVRRLTECSFTQQKIKSIRRYKSGYALARSPIPLLYLHNSLALIVIVFDNLWRGHDSGIPMRWSIERILLNAIAGRTRISREKQNQRQNFYTLFSR